MAKTKPLDLQFPAAGVVRRWGLNGSLERRAPYPTPWSVNCRLEDSLTGRLRGGSFTAINSVAKSDPVYRDRAIVIDGTTITCSRQGAHTDFTYSADVSDAMRPAIFQLSEAGEIGGTVIAVVPVHDATMLCFTEDETWVLQGDPATGILREVSEEVGIVGADAWCIANDTVYFLSHHGLYSVSASGGSLAPVSEDKVPEDLTGVYDEDAILTYYHPERAVYIHLSAGLSWFYDAARDGFWPFSQDTTDSHLLIGPFRLGQAGTYGRIQNLHAIIAEGSADVTWRIVIGDTAEEAADCAKSAIELALESEDFSAYVDASGTWTAGRSHMDYPRTRAMWACLWLASEGDWAYEAISMTAMISGGWR